MPNAREFGNTAEEAVFQTQRERERVERERHAFDVFRLLQIEESESRLTAAGLCARIGLIHHLMIKN